MTAPSTPTVVDMRTMDTAAVRTLLLAPDPAVSFQVDVLGPDLLWRRSVTDRLQPGGSVEWNGSSRVHRTCSLTLALKSESEIDWAVELLRVSVTIAAGGVAAFAPIGTFTCGRPQRSAGVTIDDPKLGPLMPFSVDGQDVTALADRQVGYSYTAPASVAGTAQPVLDAARKALTDAGFPVGTVLVDGAAQAATMAADATWPWFAGSTNDAADAGSGVVQPKDATDDSDSGPATWRTVVNDLVGQVVYRALWADGDGLLRLVPYVDPLSAPPAFTFSANDSKQSSIEPPRTASRSVSTYNAVTYVWTNIAPDGTTPTYANGGLYDRRDQVDIAARGGPLRGVDPAMVELTAATADAFKAAADADFAQQRGTVTTITATTVLYPLAGHFDVFTVEDSQLLGGSARVQATSWKVPLDSASMAWEWKVIS